MNRELDHGGNWTQNAKIDEIPINSLLGMLTILSMNRLFETWNIFILCYSRHKCGNILARVGNSRLQ